MVLADRQPEFRRIAIVNRGHVAQRFIQSLREFRQSTGLALESIALFTEADREARFVREADHSYCLGSSTYTDAQARRRSRYLDEEAVTRALQATQADAVWVGWGYVPAFLPFASLVTRLGLTYVGADPACFPLFQDKLRVKALARSLDIPTLPAADPSQASEWIFPAYLKACLGGAGRYQERVESRFELADALLRMESKAHEELGDSRCFLEAEVPRARLISVQAMAGRDGQLILLGTREGSLQLQGHKVLEEAPAQGLPKDLQERLLQWTDRLLSEGRLVGLASVEFLWDSDRGEIWLLEVNPRLETAFTLTEALTDVDLIKAQLRISLSLPLPRPRLETQKVAVEVHLRAEDPLQDFAPAVGLLDVFRAPSGPGVRVETSAMNGDHMVPGLSPLLAKLIVEGEDRREAFVRLDAALRHMRVLLRQGWTNQNFLSALVRNADLQVSPQTTDWLGSLARMEYDDESEAIAFLVTAIESFRKDESLALQAFRKKAAHGFPLLATDADSTYELIGSRYRQSLRCLRLAVDRYRIVIGSKSLEVRYQILTTFERRLSIETGRGIEISVVHEDISLLVAVAGMNHRIYTKPEGLIRAPAPGVVQQILVTIGSFVKRGDPILKLEAMKMEMTLRAPFEGKVQTIHVLQYNPVGLEAPLLHLERQKGEVEEVAAQMPALSRLLEQNVARSSQPDLTYLPIFKQVFLGIERHEASLRQITAAWKQRLEIQQEQAQSWDLGAESIWLEMYVDRQQLFARSVAAPERKYSSAEEDLLLYLATGSTRSLKNPEAFQIYASKALDHYGIDFTSAPMEEQYQGFYQLFLAQQTDAVQLDMVTALLQTWRSLLQKGRGFASAAALRPLLLPLQRLVGHRSIAASDLAYELQTLLEDPELILAHRDYREEKVQPPKSAFQLLRSFVHEELFHYTLLQEIDGVYLFQAKAHDPSADERGIIVFRIDAPTTKIWPELTQRFRRANYLLRLMQAERPLAQRLHWNRIYIEVAKSMTWSLEQLRDFAETLAPSTEHVGLECVVVRVQWQDEPKKRCLGFSQPHGLGLLVRELDHTDLSPRALTAYDQKVLKLRQRGLVYPFELIKMYCPSATDLSHFPLGRFTEYDLDDERLQPVDRPWGEQKANLICGIVEHRTDRHPQGMKRVVLMGDPSRALGSLAEPECRRIIGALDLASELGVPVEWFALSSGAKIAMDSGTENMDWIAAALRRIVLFTQAGGEINVIVMGINVGAQPYFNAEATMLMHTRGILIMMPQSAMVLTGKRALDYSGGVSADDDQGIGGYDRVMGHNGQAQYFAPDSAAACALLLQHYDYTYKAPGQTFPARLPTADSPGRDITLSVHGDDFATLADVWSKESNQARKRPFHIRRIMEAVVDVDRQPLERWKDMRDAEIAVCWDAQVGGFPVAMVGIESEPIPRKSIPASDGPEQWTGGTLFPASSKKIARMINAASGNRPLVLLANLSGFDGSPESMRNGQLEFGAEIGRAVVNFQGPILLCVVSRFHGGAYVVFSRALNEQLDVVALEGTYASVIGGAPAAGVVFAGEVEARTKLHPEIRAFEARMAAAPDSERSSLKGEFEAVRARVRAETVGVLAEAFDREHSVERALRVGSIHRIIRPAELRLHIIQALEDKARV